VATSSKDCPGSADTINKRLEEGNLKVQNQGGGHPLVKNGGRTKRLGDPETPTRLFLIGQIKTSPNHTARGKGEREGPQGKTRKTAEKIETSGGGEGGGISGKAVIFRLGNRDRSRRGTPRGKKGRGIATLKRKPPRETQGGGGEGRGKIVFSLRQHYKKLLSGTSATKPRN